MRPFVLFAALLLASALPSCGEPDQRPGVGPAAPARLPARVHVQGIPDGVRQELALPSPNRSTVVYAISAHCGCVQACQKRLAAIRLASLSSDVGWIGVACDLDDSPVEIARRVRTLNSPFPFYLDVDGEIRSALGFGRAGQYAVLDRDGVPMATGSIGDDLDESIDASATKLFRRAVQCRMEEAVPAGNGYSSEFGCKFRPIRRARSGSR